MKAKQLFDANNESQLKIVSNGRPRPVLNGWELTEKEREEFDYIENVIDEPYRFFRYKGNVYDLQEFILTGKDLEDWDGVRADSFFSAVVIKLIADDNESVIAGSVYS